MDYVAIIGTGRYLPEHIMTNDDLSNLVDTSDEWIRTRTGIEQRRISTEMTTSDLAYEAGVIALKNAGLKATDIDLIICATITPDYFMPSCACIVQNRLGAINAAAFDLTAACTGMIYGMVTAEQFIKSGMYKNVLVIGTETLSKILDWEDRSTCVLFGDGAGAAVLSQSKKGGRILTSNLEADGSKYNMLTCPALPLQNPYGDSCTYNQLDMQKSQHSEFRQNADLDNYESKIEMHGQPRQGLYRKSKIEMHGQPRQGLYRKSKIEMHGQEVFKYAVRTITDNINAVEKKANLRKEDIAYIIPHQANQRIIEQASKFSEIPLERFFMNLDNYGNTSAASIGIALDELVESGVIENGDKLILVGFGGGMTSGAILIEWI